MKRYLDYYGGEFHTFEEDFYRIPSSYNHGFTIWTKNFIIYTEYDSDYTSFDIHHINRNPPIGIDNSFNKYFIHGELN